MNFEGKYSYVKRYAKGRENFSDIFSDILLFFKILYLCHCSLLMVILVSVPLNIKFINIKICLALSRLAYIHTRRGKTTWQGPSDVISFQMNKLRVVSVVIFSGCFLQGKPLLYWIFSYVNKKNIKVIISLCPMLALSSCTWYHSEKEYW